jgi:hypothetical protein
MQLEERRRKRSIDPLIALHYQLAYARQDGRLDAIVVADPSGVMVAGAGAWAACEELAAYAPLLAEEPDVMNSTTASRVQNLRRQVDVRRLEVDGQQMLLCARGGVMRGVFLDQAAGGIARILRPAA